MTQRAMPTGFGGGDWANQSVVNPLGVVILLASILIMLKQPRNRAILPLIFFMVAIPSAQRVVIATLDFSFVRIFILLMLARIFVRKDGQGIRMEKPDFMIRWWVCWGILAYGILLGGFSGLITRTGYMLDAAGAYYIGRVYVRSIDDVRRIALMLGLLAIPMMIFFIIERGSGLNMFSIFGGVPEVTMIRNDRLRCQGPFSHPIMAGVFWASILPWLSALWFSRSANKLQLGVFIGCVAIIVGNTASSTPVMAVLFSILGISMFGIRKKMGLIRRSGLIILIILHMVMKAPVWHLISRIDLSGGSTGWHRYNLIQQAINHVGEWWLVGGRSTAHWGWGLQDITNQYVLEGVRGGLLEMIFFMLFIWRVFVILGQGMDRATSKEELWILWSSGVMVFVHSMNFLAVSYFGQVTSAFFLLIGTCVSVSSNKTKS